jgi:dUTP pyrophosphatase
MMLPIKRLTRTATVPTKANESDAGFDLYADENITLKTGETSLVSTGVSMAIPADNVGLIWDRSSMGVKGVHRFAGVIDSGYRGEVKICLHNTAKDDYRIECGDRVAQILIQSITQIEPKEVTDLDNTDRGGEGFGSTGK